VPSLWKRASLPSGSVGEGNAVPLMFRSASCEAKPRLDPPATCAGGLANAAILHTMRAHT
jgi:hypothetical protein